MPKTIFSTRCRGIGVIPAAVALDYGLSGAVQHGASTLPDSAFNNFPQRETAEIVERSEEMITGDEGCLSFPGIFFSVQRNLRAIVRAHDVNGKEFELDGTELTARCMLHETDHCDGIVFLDKMTPLKREIVKRRIKKLQKAGEWPA